MGALSLWHLAMVAGVIALLFGRNVVSGFMADLGKGIRALRDVHKEET